MSGSLGRRNSRASKYSVVRNLYGGAEYVMQVP